MAYLDTRFCVQISKGKTVFTMVTDDMERLAAVASECRRLRDSACMRLNFYHTPNSQLLY